MHPRPHAKPHVVDTRPTLVERGELLRRSVFAKRMGWSHRSLARALMEQRLFAVEGHGEQLYPAFYANRQFWRPDLEAVCRRLGDLQGGSKWTFFVTPKLSLDRLTPLQALERGSLRQVLVAAAGFAER